MPPSRDPAAGSEEHRYPLFDDGREVGRLVWRARPRQTAGWFLLSDGGTAEKLSVDAAIDDLASQGGDEHAWTLHAEVAAILSTALALDAAERTLHERPERRRQRFARLERTRYEVHVRGIGLAVLARAVPEMAVTSVSDVVALEGELAGDAVPVVLRRLALLGGTVVEVVPGDRP
jgi:hypothetical protein